MSSHNTYRKQQQSNYTIHRINQPECNDNLCIEQLCQQLMNQIKKIKKQMKKKVDRNQFSLGMSGKLSISEISKLNNTNATTPIIYKQTGRSKENIPTNLQINSQRQNHHHSYQHNNNTNNNSNNNNEEKNIIKIQTNLNQFKQKYSYFLGINQDKITDLQDRIQQIQQEMYNHNTVNKQYNAQKYEQMQKRISEIQASVYRKADRSQLDKLFTYHQLLVIQLQQVKQTCQHANNSINTINVNKQSDLNAQKLQQKYKQILDQQKHYILQQINKKIVSNQQETEHQLMQLKKEIKYQLDQQNNNNNKLYHRNQRESSALQKSIQSKLYEISEDIRQQISSHTLHLRQLSIRTNVLQHKQGQMTRAAIQFDNIKACVQNFRIDLRAISNKNQYHSENTKQYCRQINNNFTKQIYIKIQKQMELACEDIGQKMVKLLNNAVIKSDYQEDNNRLRQKLKRLSDQNEFLENRLQQICLKFDQNEEVLQQGMEKVQQQISQSNNYLLTSIQNIQNQIKQNLKPFITCEQLKEIANQIQFKISKELQIHQKQQERVNQVLCSENVVAKLLWNSNKFKGGNLIQWDKQLTNTLPQNFRWSPTEDPMVIIIGSSGFYKIQMGIYSKKKPTVQLIINGKTVLSAINSSSYVLHHSSGRLKDVGGKENTVSGLTYFDFLLLKENSRLAVSYVGEPQAQGFIIIQRL